MTTTQEDSGQWFAGWARCQVCQHTYMLVCPAFVALASATRSPTLYFTKENTHKISVGGVTSVGALG